MRTRLYQMTLQIMFLMPLMPVGLSAIAESAACVQSGARDDEPYAGKWVGTYVSEAGGSGNVTVTLSKDEKGQWQGTVKYTNQDGERTAGLKALEITGTKLKAKIDSTNDEVEITLEGEFKETELSGTYSVLEKSSKEVVEKGTWKTAKS